MAAQPGYVVVAALPDAPAGALLSLNVPDRPGHERGKLRPAGLARRGSVQARVVDVDEGGLRLGEQEVSDEPEEGTGSALLLAAHPTLTALRSVGEDENRLVPQWLASVARERA